MVPGGSGATLGEIQGQNSGFLPKYHFWGETTTRGVARATAHARHGPHGAHGAHGGPHRTPWGPKGAQGAQGALNNLRPKGPNFNNLRPLIT